MYSQDYENKVLENLLTKANHAIERKETVDLPKEFNELNKLEPYTFSGLFTQMDKRHNPIFESKDINQALTEMREKLKSRLTLNEIESDEHLRNFVLQVPLETIWVDDTSIHEQ